MPSLNPPTYLRARVLLDIGRSRRREVRKFGHDDISHEGVTSAKRAGGDYPGMPKIHDFDIGRGETDGDRGSV